MPCSLGVIGFGRMAQAIVNPLIDNGEIIPENISCIVASKKSVQKILDENCKDLNVITADDSLQEQAWRAPIQLLAIKPQHLNLVAKQAKRFSLEDLPEKPLMVSVLAGVSLQSLKNAFPCHYCVRAVPNTPSLVGAGLTAIAWTEEITSNQKEVVKGFFSATSEVFDLPEEQLDAFLALTSSGPGYLALIAEALADGAVAAGLSRALSYSLTKKTIAGTAKLLLEKNLQPSELKDMVASPGGTTIAAIRHLEKSGLRSALIEAVLIAKKRSQELSFYKNS